MLPIYIAYNNQPRVAKESLFECF